MHSATAVHARVAGRRSAAGLVVALVVLLMTLHEKFFEGGWATVCLTLLVVAAGVVIRRQYDWVSLQRRKLDKVLRLPLPEG